MKKHQYLPRNPLAVKKLKKLQFREIDSLYRALKKSKIESDSAYKAYCAEISSENIKRLRDAQNNDERLHRKYLDLLTEIELDIGERMDLGGFIRDGKPKRVLP